MSNLVNHAVTELKFCGYKLDGTDDPYNKAAIDAILDLVKVFSEQGHSGFSGEYVVGAFEKLARFEPLGPITGADDEWHECGDGVFQNKRCGHVFKQADIFDGQAYDLNAVVFEEPTGSRFTGQYSRRPVVFPYTPRTVYAKVDEDASDHDKSQAADAAWANQL